MTQTNKNNDPTPSYNVERAKAVPPPVLSEEMILLIRNTQHCNITRILKSLFYGKTVSLLLLHQALNRIVGSLKLKDTVNGQKAETTKIDFFGITIEPKSNEFLIEGLTSEGVSLSVAIKTNPDIIEWIEEMK